MRRKEKARMAGTWRHEDGEKGVSVGSQTSSPSYRRCSWLFA